MLKRLFSVHKFQVSGPFYVPGTLCLSDTSYLDNLYRHQREKTLINIVRVLIAYGLLAVITIVFFALMEAYRIQISLLFVVFTVGCGFCLDTMLSRREQIKNLANGISLAEADCLTHILEPYKKDPLIRDTIAEILKFDRLPCRKEEIEIRKYLAKLDDQKDLGAQRKNVMDAFARLATE